MRLAVVFLAMCLLGGSGGAAGSILGNGLGSGGVFAGGFAGGALMVVVGGYLATRLGWIVPEQRFWTIVGGLLGFVAAALVTLATLSSPVGPIAGTLLIGMGATFGTAIGGSAHVRHDE